MDQLSLLRLMHLADSALPIGSTAHSFGLETLVSEETINVEQLELFLQDYLEEAGGLESMYCRLGYRLASSTDGNRRETQWLALNTQLSALKTARESRTASATLGRRFLTLVQAMEESPLLREVAYIAKVTHTDIHYSPTFGLVGGVFEVSETATVLAYLQQSLMSLVSACQRLMPLGQSRASSILWHLKPTLIAIASHSEATTLDAEDITVFTPFLDIGSMRHPALTTRLFIS
ncbi:MAG: urease accessory protein UreF [Ktedonobacteraceae bacterium]